jgi:hypothetical protein
MRSDGIANTAAHVFRARHDEVCEESPSDTASHPGSYTTVPGPQAGTLTL